MANFQSGPCSCADTAEFDIYFKQNKMSDLSPNRQLSNSLETAFFYKVLLCKLNVNNSCPVSGDQILNRIRIIFVCCKTHLKNKILTLRKDLICLKDISVEGFCDVCVQIRVKRGGLCLLKKNWSGLVYVANTEFAVVLILSALSFLSFSFLCPTYLLPQHILFHTLIFSICQHLKPDPDLTSDDV